MAEPTGRKPIPFYMHATSNLTYIHHSERMLPPPHSSTPDRTLTFPASLARRLTLLLAGLLLSVGCQPAMTDDGNASDIAEIPVAPAENPTPKSTGEIKKPDLKKPDLKKPEVKKPDVQETTNDGDDIDEASAEPVDMIGPGKKPPKSLQPLIKMARHAKTIFETKVDSYTCLLVKREMIEGKLEPTTYLRLKIRERRVDGENLVRPQSIYAKFLKPDNVAGREVLYVENQFDGDMLVRRGGTRLPNLTLKISPDGRLAKQESKHSFVQTGIRPMVEQILERMESEKDASNLAIRYFADAKVDGRPCQHIEVRQLQQRPDSTYHVAKVYVDEEYKLPVYFSSYSWAEDADGEPVLQEQYAITKIDLQAELTDLDFDRDNPEYKFQYEEDEKSE